jgi:hypothetical protein
VGLPKWLQFLLAFALVLVIARIAVQMIGWYCFPIDETRWHFGYRRGRTLMKRRRPDGSFEYRELNADEVETKRIDSLDQLP